jgi:putative DNA methylase
MSKKLIPYALKDAPALIEHLLPVHKLSAEVYKERKAGPGQTLTALGSFWKGRKPLILNKACILGCLLPVSQNLNKDLEIFELLMGMDEISLKKRLRFREDEDLPVLPYSKLVEKGKRPEELGVDLQGHIWDKVNAHLGTQAHDFAELVEQLGILRFGRRPRVADTFSGSGQIPFEAARLGCDVYASDLNPMACLLTWGGFHLVGGQETQREMLKLEQAQLVQTVQAEIDRLGIEQDGNGWTAKVYLYCLEVVCPQSGWKVPLLPTRILSTSKKVIVHLVPNPQTKTYLIEVESGCSEQALLDAKQGTVKSEGREAIIYHTPVDQEYRSKLSTLRGDFRTEEGDSGNRLRLWEKTDLVPRSDDILQERLYAVQWALMQPDSRTGKLKEKASEFRAVTSADMEREQRVLNHVQTHLADWQKQGWLPDLQIETGYNTRQPIWERGWTHWHHLFNPRQLLVLGLCNKNIGNLTVFGLLQSLNRCSRLCQWDYSTGSDKVQGVFYNQALNTFYNYGCRPFAYLKRYFYEDFSHSPLPNTLDLALENHPAEKLQTENDLYIRPVAMKNAV